MKAPRVIDTAAGAILATTGALTVASTQTAAASSNVYVSYDDVVLGAIGQGWFNADPSGNAPGDAIIACGRHADGLSYAVELDINPKAGHWDTDRVASTHGHRAGYCTGWKLVNIAEETKVALRICMSEGNKFYCETPKYGRA